jgi:hypothetical protein
MKETIITKRFFLRSIFTNGEVSKIRKDYTISNPFHIQILRDIKFDLHKKLNNL